MIDNLEPVINGNIIAWTQYDLEGYSSVYYKDLATGIINKVLNTKNFSSIPQLIIIILFGFRQNQETQMSITKILKLEQ